MRKFYKPLIALGVIVVLVAGAVGPTVAHETKTVDDYDLTFGGTDEPLITGERMWLELEIVDNETGEPVANQSETLNLSVQKLGKENATLEVSERFGEPGVYEAPVIFTEPDDYIVHVRGSIEGTEFHIQFETEVEDHTDLRYPDEESQNNATQTTRSN